MNKSVTAAQSRSELPSQQKIMKIAALLFASKGFHAVSMKELCDELDISRGAFYHYFRSKDDVLYEICTRYMSEVITQAHMTLNTEPDPVRCLYKLGQELLTVIANSRSELTVCFREIQSLGSEQKKKVLALHRDYESIWKKTVERGAATGQLLPYSYSRLKSILGMYYYSYIWIDTDRSRGLPEAIRIMNEITLKGLRA